jgi:hypothetical protein
MRDIKTIDPSCNWWPLFAVRLGNGVGRCRRDVADALLDERTAATVCRTIRVFRPLDQRRFRWRAASVRSGRCSATVRDPADRRAPG